MPADLVEAAKQREIIRDRTAASSLLNLAGTWSQALAVEHRTPADDVAAIARVTPAQVDALLRTYFTAATVTTLAAINGPSKRQLVKSTPSPAGTVA